MELSKLESILDHEGILFLSYGGRLSQAIIVGMTEALEQESASKDIGIKLANNILTIFIELSQNMMTYTKSMQEKDSGIAQKGLIIVAYDENKKEYCIISRNMIREQDVEEISPKIDRLLPLDKVELKDLYRKLRKSGRDKHERGAGLGFIEIARRCDKMDYSFHHEPKNSANYFSFKATLHG